MPLGRPVNWSAAGSRPKWLSASRDGADIVTDVDLASEKLILGLLTSEFPDFSILSEESEPVINESAYTWVVDPIDGTRNFAEGIPHYCVVVALARGPETVAGVTYDPWWTRCSPPSVARGPFSTASRCLCRRGRKSRSR